MGKIVFFGNERPVSRHRKRAMRLKSGGKRKIEVVWFHLLMVRESSDGTTALPILVLCQEFIDALPVKVSKRLTMAAERMIDINSRDEDVENGYEKVNYRVQIKVKAPTVTLCICRRTLLLHPHFVECERRRSDGE